jgi:hypothetical protein
METKEKKSNQYEINTSNFLKLILNITQGSMSGALIAVNFNTYND